MHLSSTSDLVRVVTDAAADVDVEADYIDLTTASGVTADKRTLTLISTATTTTVVASPASGDVRRVKNIAIRNRDTADATKVTVVHSDGTNIPEIISVVLAPGQELLYEEDGGWQSQHFPIGREMMVFDDVFADPAVGEMRIVALDRDVTNDISTANTIKSILNMFFPARPGHRYWFRAVIQYTCAATTTGSRFTVNCDAANTALRLRTDVSLTTTSRSLVDGVALYDNPTGASATSAATDSNVAVVEGFVDGVLYDSFVYLRFASEIASSAITAKAGSMLIWQRVT